MRNYLATQQHRPLWFLLTVPFITIISVAILLTSYFALRNSQITVNTIAKQLLAEINARIETHLEAFLETPQLINESTANAIQRGSLDITDPTALRRYFWQEVQIYDSVTSIYFGNTSGGVIVGGREGADGSLYVMLSSNLAAGEFIKYATDQSGKPGEPLSVVPNYDGRTRPWYTGAVERQGPNWSAPYILSTGQDLAIAASLPIYDSDGELLGVASVDIFLSHLNDFLQGFQIGKTGLAYIVDQSGQLVSTSNNTPAIIHPPGSNSRQMLATDSPDPIIATTAHYILDEFDSLAALEGSQHLTMGIDRKDYYLWITPYNDANGLNWYIVVTIPKDDFFAQINDHNRVTIVLTILAISLAIFAGIIITLQVSRPISSLSQAATEIAQGNWQQNVPVQGAREVRQLGEAFNAMATQLHGAFSHLEERVRVRTAELAASETRYRGIVEDQTELICRFRPDNTLTFVNYAYCRFFNKTPEELLGQSYLPRIPVEDHGILSEQFAKFTPDSPTVTVEHRVFLPNGAVRWMQWVNRALFDLQSDLIEIQAVGRDITDHKQFEQTLQKTLDHEIELNELKTHFISTVSHEFRTPMTAILHAAEIMEQYRDRLSPEKQRVYTGRIRTQIAHMTNLLEDVLTINRAERGKQEFSPEVLDIVNLCQTVINNIRAAAETPVNIQYDTTGDCSAVTGDRQLLQLIISNLVSNAVKCSPANATIKIGVHCFPEQMTLTVQDEGVGIPKEAQMNIFEPFFRAGNMDTVPGTGLGLTIVKYSIERHGGTITFDSEVGKGTTFTATFPHHQPTEQ